MTWRRWTGITLLLALPLAASLLTGCAGDGKAGRVSGKVTFKGAPVPGGQIIFSPDSKKNNSGPQGFATIRGGAYDTGAARNVPVGPVLVRIEGFNKENENEAGAERLFIWETTLDVSAGGTTKDFEVPATAAKNAPKATGPLP